MTVGEFRDVLCSYPAECEIVLAKDGEGNGFSPMADHDAGWYTPATTWSGDVTEKRVKGSKEVMVLWPTN